MQFMKRGYSILFTIPMVFGSMITMSGCNQKEKVIDIETPAGDIEVERTKGSGKVDVDIKVDRK